MQNLTANTWRFVSWKLMAFTVSKKSLLKIPFKKSCLLRKHYKLSLVLIKNKSPEAWNSKQYGCCKACNMSKTKPRVQCNFLSMPREVGEFITSSMCGAQICISNLCVCLIYAGIFHLCVSLTVCLVNSVWKDKWVSFGKAPRNSSLLVHWPENVCSPTPAVGLKGTDLQVVPLLCRKPSGYY